MNSGSSANLLALSCLTSPELGERRLNPGDEVITVATGFPTTVNPIIQNRLIPVFVDVNIPTYNIDVTQLETAYSAKTRAVMLAHTLGNPFDLAAVTACARRHGLWLIEDCCDAVGSTYRGQLVGTFGESTFSSSPRPPHHHGRGRGRPDQFPDIDKLVRISSRLGPRLLVPAGQTTPAASRFDWKFGDLPSGYDHKYIYSHIGYNLKVTDMQAAVGVAQSRKAADFYPQPAGKFARAT